ncbi:MAG: PD40 domain-containing protein [Bacteroidales bacterium]|nr:PD40 domain-containing protein [Bacteroidales bacterium]
MKKILKSLVLLVLALFVMAPVASYAQNYHTKSKKAVKYYKSAKKQYDKRKYPKTFKYLDKALDVDPKFADALLLKAELSMTLHDDAQAIESYEQMFAADSMAFPKSAIALSKLYLDAFRFSDAVKILYWYVKVPNQKTALILQAKDLLAIAQFRDEAFNNPVQYDPTNLGEYVNTDGDEYVNQILPDNSRLFFTRRSGEPDKQSIREEQIYWSAIVDGEYKAAMPLEMDWHNNKRTGALTITPNQSKIYFVGIDFIDSYGRGDIYSSDFVDNQWAKPVNLGNIVNTSTMESQPSISADGKELYFVRYSRTYESTDIYYSQFYQGKWTNPKPVTNANSKGNEMSPFLHPDGNTLYFASDGIPGMGGYDIFMCKKIDRGEWSDPVNLGYPINSEKNEISFVVSTDGKKGYISTDRDGGFGGYDIYVFDLDQVDQPQEVDMRLFVMRNINFEFDSAVIDTIASGPELDSLASFMTENPNIRIEISGYTDNTGDSAHNQTLSVERAEAVKNAMIERGIEEDRMVANGYGENRPLVPNLNEKNKAINRRVEVRVIY